MKVQAGIKQVATDLAQAKGALEAPNKNAGKRNVNELVKPKVAASPAPAPAPPRPQIPYQMPPEGLFVHWEAEQRARASIQKIINAIVALNCPTCSSGFVLMVAKTELKKWEDSCRG